MIVTIHQPNYLPYLGFFEKMANSDIFIIYDNTQYKSQDFQNRNRIRTPKEWIWLTIPLTYEFGTQIKDIKFANDKWKKDHWKSIEANYSRAPYFYMYKDRLKKIYESSHDTLSDFNTAIIKEVAEILDIKTKIVKSSELIPELNSKSTQALVNICKKAGAKTYISGADGEKYLDLKLFEKENIKVIFQKYNHPEYNQAFPGFEKYMCILDLIFNHGQNSLNILMNRI
jgi:hypothetical protein